MSQDVIMGIDPDIHKDGVATLFQKQKRENGKPYISVEQCTFGKTINRIQQNYIRALSLGQTFIVLIEAGWLNKGNFHLRPQDSRAVIIRKGVDQGRNHQRGMDIQDFCEYNKIPYELIPPLRKSFSGYHLWNGPDGKITQQEIEAIMGPLGRLNQEGRDAALIAWEYAGLPISICKFG